MAKRGKSQPKEDLIESLLDDVKGIAPDPFMDEKSLSKSMTGSSDHAHVLPSDEWQGLADKVGKAEPTNVTNPSVSVLGELSLNIPGNKTGIPGEKPELPNFGGFDGPPMKFDAPSADEGPYQGPSAGDGGFQSIDQLGDSEPPAGLPNFSTPDQFASAQGMENEATRALNVGVPSAGPSGDRTNATGTGHLDNEATLAADGFALRRTPKAEPQEKVVIGALRGNRGGNVFTQMDASLAQAENLKIAQQKILDLEKENDRLRQENEEVSSAADIIRHRLEEMTARITTVEREKADAQESAQNEITILKGNLQFKDSEVAKARLKIDELDARLRNDFKKIRVKERELENRLELARAEKAALVRAKDENILELKRKIDQLQSEIDNYREKCLELNKTIGSHQEQFKRTVRALRLALSNLEAKDDNVVPLKKAD